MHIFPECARDDFFKRLRTHRVSVNTMTACFAASQFEMKHGFAEKTPKRIAKMRRAPKRSSVGTRFAEGGMFCQGAQ